MSTIYAGQIQTTLKEIVRRSEDTVTRGTLITDAALELGVDTERVVTQLDQLDRKGEVYHVGEGEHAEVRVP